MKKTVNINLAGYAFQIDEDAYQQLEKYLNQIKATFNKADEQEEIINDIEHRFAELFTEKLKKNGEVVTHSMVNDAIATLGDVEEIAEEAENVSSTSKEQSTQTVNRKLFRSTDEKVIAGVLGGLGTYLNIDPIWLRLLFVILAIASVGVPVGLIYIILWIVIPKAETTSQKLQMKGEPVNLNSIQDSIKKNLSSENVKRTGAQFADSIGEIVKVSGKTIVGVIALIVGFKLFVFAVIWFFASFFMAFIGPEYVELVFANVSQYVILSFVLFFLIALPIILGVYLLVKVLFQQSIQWAKVLLGFGISWIILLILSLVLVFQVAKNYRAVASQESFLAMPFQSTSQELTIGFEPNEDEQFHFHYDGGEFESSGIEIADGGIYLSTVHLDIEDADTDELSILVKTSARGKDKANAEEYLQHFEYEVQWVDSNQIIFPSLLFLNDEQHFRFQELTFVLKVPKGTKLHFKENAAAYIGHVSIQDDYKKSNLSDQSWIMTSAGLDCFDCE